MARGRFSSTGVMVGQTLASRWEKRLQHQKGNSVTMGVNVPRQSEGAVGDITVREISSEGNRVYIKTNSGWVDINTMQSADKTKWVNMVLAGSWATDDTYGTPQYFKDTNGFVHFRGGVDSGSVTSTITTLPAGFRPQFEQRRLVNRAIDASIHIQAIRIATTGIINRPYASSINLDDSVDVDLTAEICFDGISFFAGQTIRGSGGGTSGSGGGGGLP